MPSPAGVTPIEIRTWAAAAIGAVLLGPASVGLTAGRAQTDLSPMMASIEGIERDQAHMVKGLDRANTQLDQLRQDNNVLRQSVATLQAVVDSYGRRIAAIEDHLSKGQP